MKFGLSMFPTDYAIPVTELGRAAEDLGFESLFFPEHTHIPTSRISPWPGGPNLPREYSHTLDPFVAMAAVVTTSAVAMSATVGVCGRGEREREYRESEEQTNFHAFDSDPCAVILARHAVNAP